MKTNGLLLCLLYSAAGCANTDLTQVTGLVTLDGEPLPAALVEFCSTNGPIAAGETDQQGMYVASWQVAEQSGTAGPWTVRIRTGGETLGAQGEVVSIRERVPPRYNEQSTLIVELRDDDARRDFALTTE